MFKAQIIWHTRLYRSLPPPNLLQKVLIPEAAHRSQNRQFTIAVMPTWQRESKTGNRPPVFSVNELPSHKSSSASLRSCCFWPANHGPFQRMDEIYMGPKNGNQENLVPSLLPMAIQLVLRFPGQKNGLRSPMQDLKKNANKVIIVIYLVISKYLKTWNHPDQWTGALDLACMSQGSERPTKADCLEGLKQIAPKTSPARH